MSRATDRHPGVLVTGSHRSGSTWVGRMLAAADELHYVQEPFNIVARQCWLGVRPPRQFLYLDDANGADWVPRIERVLALRYPVAANVTREPTPTSLRRSLRVAADARRARRRGAAALVKDPIALFSTPWLAGRFGLRPVILVRDAVAFVGSLKERNWTFDFRHWSQQPTLMAGPLAPHRDEIERMVAADVDGDGGRPDIVEQGIVEWNAMYDVVDVMRRTHPDFVVVSYERLALDPGYEVPALYDRLGLRFGDRQRKVVAELSTGSARGTSAIDVRRDSTAAVDTWRERLSPADVERIRAATAGVAGRLADIGAR